MREMEEEVVRRLLNITDKSDEALFLKLIGDNFELFADYKCRRMYEIIYNLEDNVATDKFEVVKIFTRKGIMTFQEGLEVMSQANDKVYITSLTLYRILREEQMRRDLYKSIENYKERLVHGDDVLKVIEDMTQDVDKVWKNDKNATADNKEMQLAELETFIEMKRSNPSDITGVASFLYNIDRIVKGFQQGRLYYVGGRPGQGKTSLSLRIALNMAHNGINVDFYSLEMSNKEMYIKLLSQITGVAQNVITSGRQDPHQELQIDEGLQVIRQLSLKIDDTPGIDVWHIKSSVLSRPPKERPDIIFIDYLQLMTMPKANNREQELSKTTTLLKNIAKELKVPIIILTQLNRENEKRPDKRPILSDMRDSGSLEASGDMVAFVHRPEYYNIMQMEGKSTNGLVEFIVAKNRFGATGTVPLTFLKATTDFTDRKQ